MMHLMTRKLEMQSTLVFRWLENDVHPHPDSVAKKAGPVTTFQVVARHRLLTDLEWVMGFISGMPAFIT